MRIAGVLACLTAAVFGAVELYSNHTANRAFGCLFEIAATRLGWPLLWISIAEIAALTLVAAAYWFGSGARNVFWPDASTRWLLLVQGGISTVVAPELLLLTSFEAGMVLPQRTGLVWVLLQTTFQCCAFYLHVTLTGDNPVLQLMGTDRSRMGSAMLMVAVVSFVWHFLAYSLGLLAASESRQSRELQRMNAELRASRHMENDAARLAERLQLSRELHDSSGHHLAALSVNLRLMRHLEAAPERNERLEESLLIVQQLLKDVREVVHDLREIQSFDLGAALRTMTAGLPEITVHLALDEAAATPPPFQAHALFRCCQEIITNTLKHSRADNLWIEIQTTALGYTLRSRDDGQGATQVRFGNGLQGMYERVSSIGGEMRVQARPGEGFRIELQMPVREKESVL